MKDEDKTREQLMEELEELRRRVTESEVIKASHIEVETALKQAKEEKQTILDSLVEHVVYHDMDMKVLWANRAACESVGMSREELIGRHCYELWPTRSDPCEDCPVEEARETGQPQALEKTTPDGRSWFIQASPVRDSNGDIVGMVEFTLEISEHKRAEEALRKAHEELERRVEERTAELVRANEQLEQKIEELKQAKDALKASEATLKAILAACPAGIGLVRNRILGWTNKAMYRMWGYEEDSLLGESTEVLYPEAEEYERVGREFYTAIEEGGIGQVETRWLTKDGRVIDCYLRGSPLDSSDLSKGVIVVAMDITERKRAVTALQEVSAEQDVLLGTVPAMIFWIDNEGRFLRVNDSFAAALNKSPDDIKGKSLFDLYPEDMATKYYEDNAQVMESGVPKTHIEEAVETPNGMIWVSTDKIPYRDERGDIIGVIGFSIDVTERKLAEERISELSLQLMKAQEMERQRISHGLHDNLAQELAGLKISLDTFFADQPDIADEKRQRVSGLSKRIQHSIKTVRDMAYDLHPASLAQFGLVQAVRQYCEEFAGRNSLKVDFFSVGMDDLELDFDTEITLYRLIQEGLNNIGKHADASQVTIRLSASFAQIMLHIEDNGKGFDVEKRLDEALGEKRMGIWGMEQRVALLNGEMKIESDLMHGTKILIKVPHMDKTDG